MVQLVDGAVPPLQIDPRVDERGEVRLAARHRERQRHGDRLRARGPRRSTAGSAASRRIRAPPAGRTPSAGAAAWNMASKVCHRPQARLRQQRVQPIDVVRHVGHRNRQRAARRGSRPTTRSAAARRRGRRTPASRRGTATTAASRPPASGRHGHAADDDVDDPSRSAPRAPSARSSVSRSTGTNSRRTPSSSASRCIRATSNPTSSSRPLTNAYGQRVGQEADPQRAPGGDGLQARPPVSSAPGGGAACRARPRSARGSTVIAARMSPPRSGMPAAVWPAAACRRRPSRSGAAVMAAYRASAQRPPPERAGHRARPEERHRYRVHRGDQRAEPRVDDAAGDEELKGVGGYAKEVEQKRDRRRHAAEQGDEAPSARAAGNRRGRSPRRRTSPRTG